VSSTAEPVNGLSQALTSRIHLRIFGAKATALLWKASVLIVGFLIVIASNILNCVAGSVW
jgi:uncharacterized membrane protein